MLICLAKVFPYFILNNKNNGEEQYVVLSGEREEGVPSFWDTIFLRNGEQFLVK